MLVKPGTFKTCRRSGSCLRGSFVITGLHHAGNLHRSRTDVKEKASADMRWADAGRRRKRLCVNISSSFRRSLIPNMPVFDHDSGRGFIVDTFDNDLKLAFARDLPEHRHRIIIE